MMSSRNHRPDLTAVGAVPDADLLGRFIHSRDQSAFRELVMRHGTMVLRACKRILSCHEDAQDAFQATFVVLSRRAQDIEPREMLAGWLHGVARRVAMEARRQACRRRTREKQNEQLAAVAVQGLPADGFGEVRPVLDEEIGKLPDKYRVPVVLCYFEGKTNDEAALQLGWSRGVVVGNLARARELLRKRLVRRGLGVPAAMLATLLGQEAATSALLSIPEDALASLAGGSTSLSPQVAVLVDAMAPAAGFRLGKILLLPCLLFGMLVAGWMLFSSGKPLSVVWRFRDGPAADLQIARGHWKHRAAGPGLMDATSTVVILPTRLPQRPFAVTVKWTPVRPPTKTQVLAVWADGPDSLTREVWARILKDQWRAGETRVTRVVFRNNWSAVYVDGKLLLLCRYEKPYPTEHVLLMLQNVAVEEIELKELRDEELPVELKDPSRVLPQLESGTLNDI